MTEPTDVELLTAALRADSSDVDMYARVLTSTLADRLPDGMVDVDRDRSLADRLSGRPGRVVGVRVRIGEYELQLRPGDRGRVDSQVAHVVHGVVISRRDVTLDEWVAALAEHLAEAARSSASAREALGRLLGA